MTKAWDDWKAGLPADLDDQQTYTATLLHALERILSTATFSWGMTGGTAAQSFLPDAVRRYSSDVEIVTPASESQVRAWMKTAGFEPEAVTGRKGILKAKLTPEGTLFVIHSYDAEGYQAANPKPRPFDHFPIPNNPPPARLDIPVLDFEFLVATKLYETWRLDRGGERRKDIHDLSLLLPLAQPDRVFEQLQVYLKVRECPDSPNEVCRRAGAWMTFALNHLPWFENWRDGIVRDPTQFNAERDLAAAQAWLEAMVGARIELSDWETVRFLLPDATPKQLRGICAKVRIAGDVKQLRILDDLATAVLPLMARPIPTELPGLLAQLDALAGKA